MTCIISPKPETGAAHDVCYFFHRRLDYCTCSASRIAHSRIIYHVLRLSLANSRAPDRKLAGEAALSSNRRHLRGCTKVVRGQRICNIQF